MLISTFHFFQIVGEAYVDIFLGMIGSFKRGSDKKKKEPPQPDHDVCFEDW